MMKLEQMRDALNPRDLSGARNCLDGAIRERDALRAFAQDVMRAWPEGDLEGGDLQDAAVRHGLLRETHPTAPCGENCWCTEYYGDEEFVDGGAICYKPTELLSPNAKCVALLSCGTERSHAA